MAGFPIVLVVEDDWLIRDAVADTLRDAGCEVLEASSGEEAVALLQGFGRELHVLFTDIQLGNALTGWDVADAVQKAWPQSAIIYASGNKVDKARQLPGSRFFEKPYPILEVVEACRTAKS